MSFSITEDSFMSRLDPLEEQIVHARRCHDAEITHIIAAEAEFASLFPEAEADTLIWLRLPEARKLSCTGARFPSEWLLRYSSAVLRESGFEKFSQLLDAERYQKKTAGYLRSTGHAMPDGVRYVLDLGPSSDFELRSEHLEALTLPKGIVQYSMMAGIDVSSRVPVCVAGGHDDACRCFEIQTLHKGRRRSGNLGQKDASPASPAAPSSAGFGDYQEPPQLHPSTFPPPPPPLPPSNGLLTPPGCIWELCLPPEYQIDDYCEVRHAANVIRLLLAMAGRPLLLNSAARVYTVTGLAKLFGADGGDSTFQNQLRSLVYGWFFVENNSVIVDVLPEECFRIAWNICLPTVARAAYRILVAERALQQAATSSGPRTYNHRQKTAFGRELSGLDDDIETMLDHASEDVLRRVNGVWDCLRSEDRINVFHLPEYNRMLAAERALTETVPPNEQIVAALAAVRELKTKFHNLITKSIPLRVDHLPETSHTDAVVRALKLYVREPSMSTSEVRLRQSFVQTYSTMPDSVRRATATYWMTMSRMAEKNITTELSYWSYEVMADAANLALHKAIVQSPGHLRLPQRLRVAGVYDGLYLPEPVTEPVPYREPFVAKQIRDDPFRAIAHFFPLLFDRTRFDPEFELDMTDPSPHLLLGLPQDAFRFLPLWAGGDDDGTGAVFQDELPTAQLGPIGPGPAYHTGLTNAGTATTPSLVGTDDDDDDDDSAVKVDMAGSTTEREHDSDAGTSTSFILVRHLNDLTMESDDNNSRAAPAAEALPVHDGLSTATGHHASIGTPSRSAATGDGDATLSSAFDMVVVEPSDADDMVAVSTDAAEAVMADEPEYEFEYDADFGDLEDIVDYDDDDNDDNDNDDDDFDDARSDDTVMPDREDGEETKAEADQAKEPEKMQG